MSFTDAGENGRGLETESTGKKRAIVNAPLRHGVPAPRAADNESARLLVAPLATSHMRRDLWDAGKQTIRHDRYLRLRPPVFKLDAPEAGSVFPYFSSAPLSSILAYHFMSSVRVELCKLETRWTKRSKWIFRNQFILHRYFRCVTCEECLSLFILEFVKHWVATNLVFTRQRNSVCISLEWL